MPKNLKQIEFAVFSREQHLKVENLLGDYLKSINKEGLLDSLAYVVNELSTNASKANLKRVHFKQKGLEISNEKDYQIGLKDFRDHLGEDRDKYFESAKKLGYFVNISFYLKRESFFILVVNNSVLLPVEKERIKEKLKKASELDNIQDAFCQVEVDQTEGAGLGFITMFMMLKNMGLTSKALRFFSNQSETKIKIEIPLTTVEEEDIIAKEVKEKIDHIPQFPPHINELVKALNQPDADFKDIANIVKKDPAFIAELLKTVNSAMVARKVNNIKDAVKMLGFQSVRNLVLGHASQKILMENFPVKSVKKIMEHSVKVAGNAVKISKTIKRCDNCDDLFTAAILHDIGKIILQASCPKLIKTLEDNCRDKGLNQFIAEKLSHGYNHAVVGASLADKWKFPESLVLAIKNHHSPFQLKNTDYFDLVSVIYIANILYYYFLDEVKYEDINTQVLRHLGINNFKEFEAFAKKIEN